MNLNKQININKKILLLVIILCVIGLFAYYSYALFQVNMLKSNVVTLQTASSINITTKVDDTNSNTVTLTGNETKTITVHLTTTGINSAIAYKMYYELTGDGPFEVTSTETFPNDKVEGAMASSKDIILTIENKSSSSITIALGAVGGYEKSGATLSGQKELLINVELPMVNRLIKKLKEEKITTNNSVTETDNGETITYLSGCSKFYYEQSISNCTAANLIDFNYVWYSGRMWRIVSFNETTNTIKLITEQPQTVIAFNADATNDATKVNFYNNASDTSYMYQWLNEDFYDSLYNPDDVINKTIQFNATQTSSLTTKPATTTMVTPTNGIGLINAYEYTRTYNKVGSSSSNYGYLNIGQYWWLLNPPSASRVWYVNYNGSGNNYSPTSTYGARPSINLKSVVTFTGSGTEDDPYRVISDKEIPDNTTTPINSRNVGEYIKLKSGNNEQVFRIVSFEGSGNSKTTKVVAIDYANSGNTLKFATSNSSGNGTVWGSGNTTGSGTWYYYLNNTYLPNLRTTYGSGMFTSGTYYLGWKATTPSDTTTTYNYKTSICSSDTTDPVSTCTKASGTYQTFDIGLLRYGEMFASQHGIGYNYKTSSYLTKTMWLLTRYSASYVWGVSYGGRGYYYSPSRTYGARPSVNLQSNVKILSGTGLPNDPYVVGI